MIVFATSLRARALADDWSYHVWLLEQVVGSMLAQTRGDVRVAVGCHDVPDSPLTDDQRVQFLPIDAALPAKNFDAMVTDKVLKLSVGARWAQEQPCDYVVFNDADDFVSNQLGAFVESRRGGPGWYTRRQWFFTAGGRVARLFNVPLGESGPCVVVRRDLLTFARPPFQGPWADRVVAGGEQRYMEILASHQREICILAAVGLAYFQSYMHERGEPLAPLPFPANVVINHGDSMSTSGGPNGFQQRSGLHLARWIARALPTLHLATGDFRREFGLPRAADIPPAHRRSPGSVFWR